MRSDSPLILATLLMPVLLATGCNTDAECKRQVDEAVLRVQLEHQQALANEQQQRMVSDARLTSANAQIEAMKAENAKHDAESATAVSAAFDQGFSAGLVKSGRQALWAALSDASLLILGGVSGAALLVLSCLRRISQDASDARNEISSIKAILLSQSNVPLTVVEARYVND